MAETVIEINGVDYYCPSDYVDYLVVIDGSLINTGSNTITLYHEFRDYDDRTQGYPRITCQAYYKAYITQSYNSTSTDLHINSYEIKNRSFNDLFLIGVIVIGMLGMILFKRR